MRKICFLSFFVILFSVAWINPALAEPTEDTVDIWKKLATIAGKLGSGLQTSGYLIAGIGLIFFSFMAIFNKISWKNLAYIMMSCLVLSVMVGIVNYFSSAEAEPEYDNSMFNHADSQMEFEQGVGRSGGTDPN